MDRMKKVTSTFRGRQEAGPCPCPVCHSAAKVLPYPDGEKWATLICPRCGWYQVPTLNAPYSTEFQVVTMELEEGRRRGAK